VSQAAALARPAEMREDNIHLPARSGDNLSRLFLGVGASGMLVLVLAWAMEWVPHKHVLIALLVGVFATLAPSLGALFFVLIFHLTMAGWSGTIRRQFENLMVIAWVPGVLFGVFVAGAAWSGLPDTWLDPARTAHDLLFAHKAVYFAPWFVALRLALYVGIIGGVSARLWRLSREQDRTGDRWLSNRMRFTSSWGILLVALATTFLAVDWIKAVTDYTFFSTMWGVYYFAGSAFACFPMVVIILTTLRSRGRLEGVVGEEHIHDLGKLMFAFTVFWAYIAFGQYFLIWYANVPEETAWFFFRKTGAWESFSYALPIGHFLIPFFVLLWRRVRRSALLLSLAGAWLLAFHVLDLYWVLRPSAYIGSMLGESGGAVGLLVDTAGIAGPFGLYLGTLVRRVVSGPLVPLHDPRLGEAIHHKNYV
jgi:MFS family permease